MTRFALSFLVLTACAELAERKPLPLTLVLPEECWGLPVAAQPVSCGGMVRLQAYTYEGDEPALTGTSCVYFDPLASFADLPDALRNEQLGLPALHEGDDITVTLEIHSPGGATCDDPSIDSLPTAYGDTGVVHLGDDASLTVPVQCVEQPPPECEDDPVGVDLITASVHALDTQVSLGQSFAEMGAFIHSGFVREEWDEAESRFRFHFERNGELSYQAGSGLWSAQTPTIFFPYDCVLTVVEVLGQAHQIASCDGSYDSATHAVYAASYWLSSTDVDALAIAAGLARVPEEGLLVGRVVDPDRQPVEGAVIDAQGAAVKYLDETATALHDVATTSASGWFVIDSEAMESGVGPRCCINLFAQKDGVIAVNRAPVGLIEQTVTATVMELAPAPAP